MLMDLFKSVLLANMTVPYRIYVDPLYCRQNCSIFIFGFLCTIKQLDRENIFHVAALLSWRPIFFLLF